LVLYMDLIIHQKSFLYWLKLQKLVSVFCVYLVV
jgi:hypothetical protein